MKSIYYILILTMALFSCEKPISDFQSESFIKFLGSGYESKGNDVIELSDGGYFITGYDKVNGTNQQIFAAKVDKNGNLVWSNTYGGNGFLEEGRIVKEVSDGYLIAGKSLAVSTGITHSFIMKTNTSGDSLWYKEFGKLNFSITVNDIISTENSIYVTGYSDSLKTNHTDYFVSKLDNSAEKIWEKYYSIGSNSSFKRVFLKDDKVMLIGTDGGENKISIVTLLQSNGNPINSENTETANESVGDASFVGDQLFVLANSSLSNTKLSKFNSSFIEEWHTESINSVVGKSVAYNNDGTLIICGESVDEESNTVINFIKVNADGSAYSGQQLFRTFQGTVGRVIQTKDKGLIMVGSTNPTYGTNVQLIKTDKDYFMLKNN